MFEICQGCGVQPLDCLCPTLVTDCFDQEGPMPV